MSYVVPQVKVFQEFTATPAAISNPLYAFVIGPNYFLEKFADGEGKLGQYDPDVDQSFAWPNRPAGAVVDQDFTTVHVDNALLRYYQNTSGDTADEIQAVFGHNNRIRAEAINFKDNPDDATNYPRSTALPARDVAVGDFARVFANVSGTTYELWSKILDILPDKSEPTVTSTTSSDPDNSVGYDVTGADNGLDNGSGGAVTNTGTGGGSRSIAVIAGDASYDGIADGYPLEIYTVTITVASSGGTGALATVTSASGTDDDTDVSITATGQTIGSRGLTFSWGGSGEWNVGDKFVIYARQDYTVPTVTGGGTFDSDTDTTYIVEVTRGGTADGGSTSTTAQISISTTNGLDVSGPHNASTDTAISIGTKGATVTFSIGGGDAELPKGQKWYITATGRTDLGYKTLVLADDLPTQLRASLDKFAGTGSSSSQIEASDLNLNLYVQKDITLPRENFPDTPNTNWTQSATEITIESGAQVFDSDFLDGSGNQVGLVLDADTDGLFSIVYVTYRALLQTHASDIQTIASIDDVTTQLGEVSTDNPLALAVWYALRNSNGTSVKYMAVPTNDLEGYNAVLDKATGRRDLYTVVPTTKDATILSAIAGHIDERSSETEGQWRIGFFNGSSSSNVDLIDTGEKYPIGGTTSYTDSDLLATVVDDPDTSGTQYTRVEWDATAFPAGGGFVDMGVRAGDIFRTNFTGDGFGGTTSEDYVVDAVLSNQTLRLVSGPSSAINVAKKFAVLRSQTKSEEATAYGATAGAYSNRRIFFVWPDVIEDAAGVQISGIYLCAAIAGLISGVVPQQGLTNVAIEGFSEVTRTTEYFAESHLNTMADAGTWIVTQDPDSGDIFTRHQLSTDDTTISTSELSVTKNVDSISYAFLNQLKSFIGRSNITPRSLVQLRRQIQGTVDDLKARGATPSLGGQLIEAELTDLRQHEINLDQVVVVLDVTIPFPMNVIELKLVV